MVLPTYTKEIPKFTKLKSYELTKKLQVAKLNSCEDLLTYVTVCNSDI